MYLILFIILLLISIGCYAEGKAERKGVKLTLSITSALMLSFMIEATAYSLAASNTIEGMPLMVAYFALPTTIFFTFQLLLYDIKVFSD
ncbi:hypothetical protein LGQ02_01090 [Bacillus shivajii]|uniref:hypothetical protein n=1 Tax=Bacillus shivajii TaxID=1983719 RepID=UPI001CF9E1E9|nr:hypothetical protein [Bacillus shivajii]UCZ53426.1 hypothetical protein LGQ02_01090 [Bacillus shivajii]